MSPFKLASQSLFFSKNDPDDIRLGEIVKSSEASEVSKPNSICLLGYPDDEGIAISKGRIGASEGPAAIRRHLYKMTPSYLTTELYDIGDLETHSELAKRHELAKESIKALHTKKIKTISLGGGHDYGYADAAGFLAAHSAHDTKPLIINFDAHLDVRPTTNGLSSGTPFFRLLNEFQNRFDFAEVGIQPQCNSQKHRDWAINKNAQIFNLVDIQKNQGLGSLFKLSLFSNLTKNTPVFISFDIDCLSSTEAPGCSQSWVTGLKTEDYLRFFSKLSQMADVRGLGIYEVSPPLDIADQTAKTAALIAYHFMFQGDL